MFLADISHHHKIYKKSTIKISSEIYGQLFELSCGKTDRQTAKGKSITFFADVITCQYVNEFATFNVAYRSMYGENDAAYNRRLCDYQTFEINN